MLKLATLALCVSVVVSAAIGTTDDGHLWERSGKFQGDMVFPESSMKNGLPISHGKRWPDNTVVYKLDSTLSPYERNSIIAAMDDLWAQSLLCVAFRPATTESDYVLITNEADGCYSNVGVVGGQQVLNLQSFSTCYSRGTIIHEMLHTFGFYHMQSDPTRNDYVNIFLENVSQGDEFNFDLIDYLDSYGESYDLDSIMHYGRYAFSANGLPTIEAKSDPNYPIGKTTLSEKDIIKLRKMYGCQ